MTAISYFTCTKVCYLLTLLHQVPSIVPALQLMNYLNSSLPSAINKIPVTVEPKKVHHHHHEILH